MRPNSSIANASVSAIGSLAATGTCLNLARRMKLSGMHQLCIANITYIRLQAELVYLR